MIQIVFSLMQFKSVYIGQDIKELHGGNHSIEDEDIQRIQDILYKDFPSWHTYIGQVDLLVNRYSRD